MSIKVKNLAQVQNKLKEFGREGKSIAKRELNISGSNIEIAAIRRAPATLGGKRNAILNIKQRIDKIITDGGMTVKVGVQGAQDLDAYVEFGTGLNFIDIVNANPDKYTKEIRDLAYQFYKTGEGTLRGTPYLFPSFFEEGPALVKRLKRELEILAAKT